MIVTVFHLCHIREALIVSYDLDAGLRQYDDTSEVS